MPEVAAKRKLSDIDFSKAGAHVALCHKTNGPANGHNYALIMKAVGYSDEYLQKMQQVKVTLELPEFLRRFFDMYWEDSEVLAKLLGYVKPPEDDADEIDWYEEYIDNKVKSFEILKTLHDSTALEDELAKLPQETRLQMLKDQAYFEKALRREDRVQRKLAKAAKESSAAQSTETVKTEKTEVPDTTEVNVQKSLDDMTVELQKAKDELAQFKKDKAEALVKSKTDAVKALVKDVAQQEILVKAGLALGDEDFTAFTKSLEVIFKQVENSALFREEGVGSAGNEPKTEEGGVTALLKTKYKKG
jgi:hypothetical protein